MRRTLSTLFSVMAMLAGLAAPAAATPPHAAVYLSVGTSLAAGSQADAAGNTTFGSDESYTDQLHQRLKGRIASELTHVKLGCPGETTDQFLGGVNIFGEASNCAGLYETGSQIGDALATIAEGNVVLISIDVGANDIVQAQQACGADAGCLLGAISAIAGNTAQIVGTMRAAGYTGPIVAMNYYNPQAAIAIGYYHGVAEQQSANPLLAQQSDVLARGFNQALAQAYGAFDVRVADVYSAFNAGDFGDDAPRNGTPDNVDVLCSLSFMCPSEETVKANFHLNRKGYRVVAKTLLEEVEALEFDK
jgi:lysophospholipase L1-like esterase